MIATYRESNVPNDGVKVGDVVKAWYRCDEGDSAIAPVEITKVTETKRNPHVVNIEFKPVGVPYILVVDGVEQ